VATCSVLYSSLILTPGTNVIASATELAFEINLKVSPLPQKTISFTFFDAPFASVFTNVFSIISFYLVTTFTAHIAASSIFVCAVAIALNVSAYFSLNSLGFSI